jgi:hypothetical protein
MPVARSLLELRWGSRPNSGQLSRRAEVPAALAPGAGIWRVDAVGVGTCAGALPQAVISAAQTASTAGAAAPRARLRRGEAGIAVPF